MKKQLRTSSPFVKHMIFSACLMGMGSAVAQDLGASDTPKMQSMETSSGLPAIRSRGEQRQAQNPPANRPAKRAVAEAGAFEVYAEGVTGQKLNMFGKDLFSDVPSTFAPFDAAQVNQDYVIGTGDELQVRGWGMVDIDVSATVDRSGAIFIPRVGSVKVSGVQYKDLQGYLKKAVGKIYTNFELTASIAQTRAVQVYVVGHAVRPGTYTLSAMSTLLNALFTSGGPDATGSMRNIQLKRGAQTVSTFDLYDMLAKGDKSSDMTLRELIARVGGANDNGYLYATQLNRESVRRAQQAKLNEVADRFERDLESNATQRMAASGDKENAAKTAAEVEQQRRIVQKLRGIKAEGRIVLDLPGVETQVKNFPDLPLQDGDTILIPRRPGTVDVLGSVFQQNAFVYRPQRTVSDYLQQAGGLTVTADKSEMYVIRADGTAQSGQSTGWFSGIGGTALNPGDTVVGPEKIDRSTFMQSLKEWTSIFYQLGLGAAGLKVLKN